MTISQMGEKTIADNYGKFKRRNAIQRMAKQLFQIDAASLETYPQPVSAVRWHGYLGDVPAGRSGQGELYPFGAVLRSKKPMPICRRISEKL